MEPYKLTEVFTWVPVCKVMTADKDARGALYHMLGADFFTGNSLTSLADVKAGTSPEELLRLNPPVAEDMVAAL